MLLVIFGAGASYDSFARMPAGFRQPDVPGRPPLANQLFDSTRFGPYIQQFPQAHAVIPELEKPNTDVEGILERFQNELREYPRRLNQLTAIRYYLQSMLSSCMDAWESTTRGVTNYKTLLSQIEHRVHSEKVLVSFNYDTLLEEALTSAVGVRVAQMSDYLSGDFKIVKLHGSINWVHKIDQPTFEMNGIGADVARDVIDRASELRIDRSFDLVPRQTMGRQGTTPIIPALSIPVANKSDYECPDDQQQALLERLPAVDKVLLIGWRAAETRFVDSMASTMSKNTVGLVVSSGEAKAAQVIMTLKDAGVKGDFFGSKQGFTQSLLTQEVEQFLRR